MTSPVLALAQSSRSQIPSFGGVAGAPITLAPELAMSGNALGLAVPPRAAYIHLNNVAQSWIPRIPPR